MKNNFLIKLAVIFFVFPACALAENNTPENVKLDTKQIQQIEIAEEYLNSIHNISANFIQTDENNNIQKGSFYLSRPGKMRWEYLYPKEILIILNDNDMVHFDKKLDQISYFCSRNDFINLLTKEKINLLEEKIYVKHLQSNNNSIKFTLAKFEGPGSFSLTFNKNNKHIKKLEVVDESQNKVDINFSDIDQPAHLRSELFEFTEHKYMRKQKNY